MSAFSRGILLRQQCLRTSFFTSRASIQHRIPPPSRFLTSTSFLSAAKKALRAAPSKIVSTSPKSAPPPQVYQSFATTLALKSHPTLLYQAPSHTYFIIASYAGATFCFTYAIYNMSINYANAPTTLAVWIPYAFAGVCALMAVLGGYLLLSPARLIKTITALPSSNSGLKPSAAPPLKIEIVLRRMFPVPFMPPRIITTTPASMTLNRPVYMPLRYAQKRGADQEKQMRRHIEERRIDESHIMTRPFRHMSRAFYKMFKAISRTWSREGFLKLGVDGQIYKLDVSGGWALDEGKALDKLVKVKVQYSDL